MGQNRDDSDAHDANRDDDFLYYLHRGSELLHQKKPQEARLSLERAHELSPQDARVENLLGLTYFKLGLLEAAKAIYDGLLEAYPNEPPLYVNLGLVLLRQGRLNEAERALRRAIAIAADHTRAHCYLGLVLYRRGDLAMAHEHFIKGEAAEFAKRVEEKLERISELRPSQAELLHAVAENGFADIEASANPFKEVGGVEDERVVRDEEAWEALVMHDSDSAGGYESGRGATLGSEFASLLPVWALTPFPAPADNDVRPPRAPIPHAPIPHAPIPHAPIPHAPRLHVSDLLLPSPPPGAFPPARSLSELRSFPLDASAWGRTEEDPAREMPEALFGNAGPSTHDLLGVFREDLRTFPDGANDTTYDSSGHPGFYAGPGPRARLVMEADAFLKTSTIVAASGRMAMTPAMCHLDGRSTGVLFGEPSDPMCRLEGRAVLLLRVPRFAVALRGVRDLQVVQAALLGFESGFEWENGKVLGIDVVTLRGKGSLLLDTRGVPMLLAVEPETPVHAAREALLAWSDSVRPSPVDGSGEASLFRLRGNGYVIVAFPPDGPPPAGPAER